MTSAIDTINANNASTYTPTSSTSDTQTLAGNFSTFLTLLTAQLQNQDPLSPMDSNQFTQQLVQFSGVEQQIKTNETLQTLIAQQKSATAGTALSYLGKSAIFANDTTTYNTTGGAAWAYSMPSTSDSVKIEVRDSTGKTVYQTTGDGAQGSHLFSWDGTQTNGQSPTNGAGYQLVITAKDSSGNAVTPTITTRETITGVNMTSDNPEVLTASGTHQLSTIQAILDN